MLKNVPIELPILAGDFISYNGLLFLDTVTQASKGTSCEAENNFVEEVKYADKMSYVHKPLDFKSLNTR